MSSRRILLISSNSSGRGGGERYLDYLSRGLLLNGDEPHVLLSTRDYMDGWATMLKETGAEVHRLPLRALRDRPLRFVQSMTDRRQQRRIASFCRDLAPDAILVNQQYDEDALDYIAGAVQSHVAPVAATLHMPMTADKNRRPLGRARGAILREWYRRSGHRILFISEGGRQEFEDYYRLRERGEIVHHGTTFGAVRTAPHASHEITIGFAGQFVPQKNLSLLVRAWAKAFRRNERLRLLLIGDGPERPALEQLLRSLAPEGAWRITGWVDDPARYLEKVDIYTMTSHFEGLPLALIEAAGQGIPCVVTDFNGASDIAARAPWVRVAPRREADLADALLKSASDASALSDQAIAGAAEFQRYFSLERMAADTVGFLLRTSAQLSRTRAAQLSLSS
jgi:glycosyltransferase involved in cell wall biosynthesis